MSLRYYAHHPADPLGDLDPGLKVQNLAFWIQHRVEKGDPSAVQYTKAAVMHEHPGKYWLNVPPLSRTKCSTQLERKVAWQGFQGLDCEDSLKSEAPQRALPTKEVPHCQMTCLNGFSSPQLPALAIE